MDHDWGLQGSITSVIFMETNFWSLLLSETIYTYLHDSSFLAMIASP